MDRAVAEAIIKMEYYIQAIGHMMILNCILTICIAVCVFLCTVTFWKSEGPYDS